MSVVKVDGPDRLLSGAYTVLMVTTWSTAVVQGPTMAATG